MAYASASDVAAYTPGLLQDGSFTETSHPTETAVEGYLDAGAALIDGRLSGAGYSTPVGSDATVYSYLTDLNALYAAGRAEMVRMTARVAATERSRSQQFMDQFNNGLDALLKMNLTGAGLSLSSGGTLYVGGISVADKEARNADTDRVQGRFSRGQFRVAGTQRPAARSDDDESS